MTSCPIVEDIEMLQVKDANMLAKRIFVWREVVDKAIG